LQHKAHAFSHSLVWVHGLAENGDMYVQMIKDGLFIIPEKLRVVIPTAPVQYCTRIKKQANSWYDVTNISPTDPKRYNTD